jgi:hypothetical protein
MEVAYSLTLEDLLALRRNVLQKKQRPPRKKGVADWVVWPVLFVLLVALFWLEPAALAWFTRGWVLFPLGVLTGVLGLVFLVLGLSRRTQKRYAANPANARHFAPRRLAITPEGINAVTENSRSFESWAAVVKVTATDEHVFLYLTSDMAHVVPRRAFIDRGDFERFVELARRYLDESRLPAALPVEPDEAPTARTDAITRKPT